MEDFVFETDVDKFEGYDRAVAECHMANFGVIVCDKTWGDPLDTEEVGYLIQDGILKI